MKDQSSKRLAGWLISTVSIATIGACGPDFPTPNPREDPQPSREDATPAPERQTATLRVNNTSRSTIYRVRAWPSNSVAGPDLLGGLVLRQGQYLLIQINACDQNFELRAESGSGAILASRSRLPIPCAHTVSWTIGP